MQDDSQDKRPPVATLMHHTDMIDSLLKVNIKGKTLGGVKLPRLVEEYQSPYVQWLISASRDRRLVLWKLYDGQPMRRSESNLKRSS